MRRAYVTIIAMSVLALLAVEAGAELRLGAVFTDHMVQQRGMRVAIYGSDTPGQVVEVDFAGRSAAGVTDVAGKWRVLLEPMSASAVGRTLSARGSTSISLSDVLVGEVWLAAGQSNMNWPVASCDSAPDPGNFDLIRMCNWDGSIATGSSQVYGADDLAKLVPEQFYVGSWQQIDAGSVAPQSGVAYFFANALAESLKGRAADGGDVPIGIIDISYGGTTTEAFIAPEYLRGEYLEQAYADPRRVRTLGGWAAGRIAQNLQGYLHTGDDPLPHPYAPGFLYWTGVDKLKDFALRGVIWYQGESNADFAEAPRRWSGERVQEYQTLVMRTLVDSWRAVFDRKDLPFLMVQLPRIDDPSRVKWPWYRAAQAAVARSRAGVELAVAPEYGLDDSNVHPPDKQPVGERLALLARQQLYGEIALAAQSPAFRRHRVEQGSIIVEFDYAGQALRTSDGGMPRHFEIASADRVFHPASAFISGATVALQSAQVPVPVAARYAWSMNIDPNIFSAAGLPVAPFRTDDWIVAPQEQRRIRIACIGDSITYGYGLADRSSESYPARLQAMLGSELFDVRNFGHSGAGFVYKQYIGQPEHAAALAFEPDIVICNLGINDISNWGTYLHSDFLRAARELFDTYSSLPTDPLIIQWHHLGPLFPGQKYYGDPNVETLNDWVADAAGVVGAVTIDMYRDFKSHPEWYPDKLHPNAAGAERIAELTYDYLKSRDAHRRSALASSRRHWRVFVLTGQSNSLGATADPTESDVSPGIEPADSNIAFFWSNRDTSGDASAAGLIGDSGGYIRELQAQQGSGSNPLFWGPEIQFARTLYATGLRDFLVVKASRGGGGNSWWYKDAADPQMYEHVVDTVNEALGQLPEDDTFEIAGLLYLQGESDSAEEASVAGERLEYLIDNLRADLPNAERMHAVIGGIAAATANDDTVRAQQQALAASDPTIDYFSNLDLQPNLYDGLHFDKKAKLIVGQRYAQAFLDSGIRWRAEKHQD
jgi:lysophospholipase L1-like esterase